MVRIIFGADAPSLIRAVRSELRLDIAVRLGLVLRKEVDITELSPEEQKAFDKKERIRLQMEEEKFITLKKTFMNRMLTIGEALLENLPNHGVVVVFPWATEKAKNVLAGVWEPLGLKQLQLERKVFPIMNLQELDVYCENMIPDEVIEELNEDNCVFYLIKRVNPQIFDGSIDDCILTAIYGNICRPPGTPESPYRQLITILNEDKENEKLRELEGIWVPRNPYSRMIALKLFFPKLADPYVPPEPEPTPPHYAIAFDAIKRKVILPLIQTHRKEILRYGFFTGDNADTAKLVARTFAEYKRMRPSVIG